MDEKAMMIKTRSGAFREVLEGAEKETLEPRSSHSDMPIPNSRPVEPRQASLKCEKTVVGTQKSQSDAAQREVSLKVEAAVEERIPVLGGSNDELSGSGSISRISREATMGSAGLSPNESEMPQAGAIRVISAGSDKSRITASSMKLSPSETSRRASWASTERRHSTERTPSLTTRQASQRSAKRMGSMKEEETSQQSTASASNMGLPEPEIPGIPKPRSSVGRRTTGDISPSSTKRIGFKKEDAELQRTGSTGSPSHTAMRRRRYSDGLNGITNMASMDSEILKASRQSIGKTSGADEISPHSTKRIGFMKEDAKIERAGSTGSPSKITMRRRRYSDVLNGVKSTEIEATSELRSRPSLAINSEAEEILDDDSKKKRETPFPRTVSFNPYDNKGRSTSSGTGSACFTEDDISITSTLKLRKPLLTDGESILAPLVQGVIRKQRGSDGFQSSGPSPALYEGMKAERSGSRRQSIVFADDVLSVDLHSRSEDGGSKGLFSSLLARSKSRDYSEEVYHAQDHVPAPITKTERSDSAGSSGGFLSRHNAQLSIKSSPLNPNTPAIPSSGLARQSKRWEDEAMLNIFLTAQAELDVTRPALPEWVTGKPPSRQGEDGSGGISTASESEGSSDGVYSNGTKKDRGWLIRGSEPISSQEKIIATRESFKKPTLRDVTFKTSGLFNGSYDLSSPVPSREISRKATPESIQPGAGSRRGTTVSLVPSRDTSRKIPMESSPLSTNSRRETLNSPVLSREASNRPITPEFMSASRRGTTTSSTSRRKKENRTSSSDDLRSSPPPVALRRLTPRSSLKKEITAQSIDTSPSVYEKSSNPSSSTRRTARKSRKEVDAGVGETLKRKVVWVVGMIIGIQVLLGCFVIGGFVAISRIRSGYVWDAWVVPLYTTRSVLTSQIYLNTRILLSNESHVDKVSIQKQLAKDARQLLDTAHAISKGLTSLPKGRNEYVTAVFMDSGNRYQNEGVEKTVNVFSFTNIYASSALFLASLSSEYFQLPRSSSNMSQIYFVVENFPKAEGYYRVGLEDQFLQNKSNSQDSAIRAVYILSDIVVSRFYLDHMNILTAFNHIPKDFVMQLYNSTEECKQSRIFSTTLQMMVEESPDAKTGHLKPRRTRLKLWIGYAALFVVVGGLASVDIGSLLSVTETVAVLMLISQLRIHATRGVAVAAEFFPVRFSKGRKKELSQHFTTFISE
ncbi:hypothetical protein HDU67_010367 [Dinochytrium kinnereticum]|nr:hypothetical protein HDU67_010367 [Dinochytrium kinnereticum]